MVVAEESHQRTVRQHKRSFTRAETNQPPMRINQPATDSRIVDETLNVTERSVFQRNSELRKQCRGRPG